MTNTPDIGAIYLAARPKVLGALVKRYHDIALAEDAVQDAMMRALSLWPQQGVPDNPEAWLFVVAKNAMTDTFRRHSHQSTHRPHLESSDASTLTASHQSAEDMLYQSDTLHLFFVCSDPMLSKEQQICLALNVLAGMTAHALAKAFVVSVSAMEKRLARAKHNVSRHALSSDAPFLDSTRSKAVKSMLYLMFNEGYSAISSPERDKLSISDQAITLTRALHSLLPTDSEIKGLLALMLFQQSRRDARLINAKPIPLEQQDRQQWDRTMILEATRLLSQGDQAAGYYRLQARIAAEHCRAPSWEETNWHAILCVYDALLSLTPSPIVALNRAAALAYVEGPERALEATTLLANALHEYQYFHATRAHLFKMMNDNAQAISAFEQAFALTTQPWEADYIQNEISNLSQDLMH
ncbi:RNA polymerase sigma factor [Enterovibrio sp. 27052020O]|uniref:RNA polymerase sigma factor n=1 Tax=Enterovibrio sp. 27052020O TaxID=3241166 RepID=UPI0038906E73